MNVLMLTLDYPPYTYGGIATHTYYLCKHLASPACSITLLVARLGRYVQEDFQIKDEPNLRVIYLPTEELNYGSIVDDSYQHNEMAWCFYNLKLFNAIKAQFDETYPKFDLIHAQHGAKFSFLVACLKREWGAKVVTTMHAMSSGIGDYVDAIRSHGLAHSDAIICVSQHMQRELEIRHPNALPNIVTYIPNGIHFEPPSHDIVKHFDLAYCGRLTLDKGFDIFVETIRQASLQALQPKIIIMGTGEISDETKEKLSSTNILFAGQISHDDVLNYLRQTKLCIIPSRKEAFGLIAAEAISCSCVPIAANIGGLNEIVVDGVNGRIFPGEDVKALTNIIIDLLSKEDKRRSMIDRTGASLKPYNWTSAARATFELYQRLMTESQTCVDD